MHQAHSKRGLLLPLFFIFEPIIFLCDGGKTPFKDSEG